MKKLTKRQLQFKKELEQQPQPIAPLGKGRGVYCYLRLKNDKE